MERIEMRVHTPTEPPYGVALYSTRISKQRSALGLLCLLALLRRPFLGVLLRSLLAALLGGVFSGRLFCFPGLRGLDAGRRFLRLLYRLCDGFHRCGFRRRLLDAADNGLGGRIGKDG